MGLDKARLEVLGRPLVAWVVDAVRRVVFDVWLVGGQPALAQELGVDFAPDLWTDAGPLGGIYSGLVATSRDTLVVGCDMPLLQPRFLRGLLKVADRESDIVVPLTKHGEYERLLGVYRRTCLPVIEEKLRDGRRRVTSIYSQLRVQTLPPERWLPWDPEGFSFVNANTPGELETIRKLMEEGGTWTRPVVSSNVS